MDKVSLNEVVNLTLAQAKIRYNYGDKRIREIAEKAGAIVYNGNRILYHRPILDEYFKHYAE